ncbi:MAG: hypothetical protein IT330_16010 [Anaerolineae bacterium]|nr:hypothetical protein [Anaerolineae bacterium]
MKNGEQPTVEQHRRLAVDCFNRTWDLLDKKQRAREEDDEMIHTAHASRYHWGVIGTPVHFARGEWQISRVYAVLKRPEPALYHARRCLEICQQNGIGDFDLAYAYEALARASMVAGKKSDAERYVALARGAGEKIAEKDDRDHFLGDLNTIPSS